MTGNANAQNEKVLLEFSLALNNRTGKYFMCKNIIDTQPLINKAARYWRLTSRLMPTGVVARALGRLMFEELRWRTASHGFDRWVPRMRPRAVMLFSDPLAVLMYDLRVNDIVLCHDLGPITHPQYYAPNIDTLYAKAYSEIAAARPFVVFVSRTSREQFEKVFGRTYSAATIIPCSTRFESYSGPATPVPQVSKPFLLTVGAVGTRKNQLGVIRAFAAAQLAERGIQLVIVGGPEPGFEKVEEIALATPGVIMTGYVSPSNLRWLYRRALGFVLASHLEGFGMPAAEALIQGLVPMVSEGGALEEVAGPSAILVDPTREASLVVGLTKLVEMTPAERQRRIDAAKLRLEAFSEGATRQLWIETIAQAVATGSHGPSGRCRHSA